MSHEDRSLSNAIMPRRALLRGAGVVLALPWLESASSHEQQADETTTPCRMLLISNNLGVLPKPFFPTEAGKKYELSPYLSELAEFRNDFTVFSGLSHPDVTGGHSTENCFLTGAPGPTRSGFRNTISLDQYAAEAIGPVTRFPTLNLGVNIDRANRSLSWTRDGVLLPAEDSASALFKKMFVQGTPKEVARQLHRLEQRGSILDALLDDAQQFQRRLTGDDAARMEQYFTSIRDVEERLHASREWELRPKPKTDREVPQDVQDKKLFFEKFAQMLKMAQLALESDSTRIVTLMVDAFATPPFKLHENQTTSTGYHNLSHHGQDVDKVKQLEDADRQQMNLLRQVLKEFAGQRESDQRLLDSTMVLYGSNMGDSNTHDNRNLPILLAGGGFKHGQHLSMDAENNVPLSNLYVSMLQRLGIEVDAFATSAGRLTGFELQA